MQFVCALFLITGVKTSVFIFAVMTSDALADRGRSPPVGDDKENTPPEQRAPTPTQDEGSSLGSLPCSVGAH